MVPQTRTVRIKTIRNSRFHVPGSKYSNCSKLNCQFDETHGYHIAVLPLKELEFSEFGLT